VTHRRALKVKLFTDFLVQRYSGDLPWDEALRRQGFLAPDEQIDRSSIKAVATHPHEHRPATDALLHE
jgi:hypothetical protein